MRRALFIACRWVAICRLWGVVCVSVLPSLAARPAFAQPAAVSSLQTQGEQQQQHVRELEQQLSQARAVQADKERRAAQGAVEIERLKDQPQSVARDLALGERLAQAQAMATELTQADAAQKRLQKELVAARRQLLTLCDRLLDTDQTTGSGAHLQPAQRLFWLRLRTAQVEALLGDGNADKARALAQSELSSSEGGDEPQELRERADLLRDSADKLRREIQRLQARSEELQRRLRLRERASRVDEDLFAEQSTARRGAGRNNAGTLEARDNAAPPAAAPTGGATVPTPVLTAPPLGSAPDPSTLDAMMRVEGPGDPTLKLQALSRAQGELQSLAADLLKRAGRLDQRATELGRQK